MSLLTYKIKHNSNFATELRQAILVANYAIKHKKHKTTKYVKHIGLKACISNQILRKYTQPKIKKVHSVKLTINGHFVDVNKETRTIRIPSLKLKLNYLFPNNFTKVNQVEVDHKYVYVCCSVEDKPLMKVDKWLGIDRNTTGHCAVVAMPHNGKVVKLGKQAFHIHRKYKKIRRHLQKKNAKLQLKRISRREHNKIKDINHKISRKIVELALENKCGIKMEKLQNIRKGKRAQGARKNKNGESMKASINSWEFYQLAEMIEYKSKICGIPVVYGDPSYTSQKCSRCGLIGSRSDKKFVCHSCGHVDHADANAAFNIAALAFLNNTECNDQLLTERDVNKGSTDTPRLETQRKVPKELCVA